MKKLIGTVGATVGSAVGWWLGAHVGLMTAFMVSMVGTGAGIYARGDIEVVTDAVLPRKLGGGAAPVGGAADGLAQAEAGQREARGHRRRVAAALRRGQEIAAPGGNGQHAGAEREIEAIGSFRGRREIEPDAAFGWSAGGAEGRRRVAAGTGGRGEPRGSRREPGDPPVRVRRELSRHRLSARLKQLNPFA